MSETAKIEVRALRKSFGSNEVLKGINLDVAKGGVVALIGPSGSGKSTLLRGINLLVVPDGGSVRVGDTRFAFGEGTNPGQCGAVVGAGIDVLGHDDDSAADT